jgi:hypothetical protein
MPTGPNDLNPRGLAEAAQDLAEVQTQARGFISRLLRSKTFAAKFDEALMRRNEKPSGICRGRPGCPDESVLRRSILTAR